MKKKSRNEIINVKCNFENANLLFSSISTFQQIHQFKVCLLLLPVFKVLRVYNIELQ